MNLDILFDMVPRAFSLVTNHCIFYLDCKARLCDFHREQAWERWLSASDHGCRAEKDEILCLIRRIAKAPDVDAYRNAVQVLQNNYIWKQKKRLRTWFSKTWLAESKVNANRFGSNYNL